MKLVYHAHETQLYAPEPEMHLHKPDSAPRAMPPHLSDPEATSFTTHASSMWKKYASEFLFKQLFAKGSSLSKYFSMKPSSGCTAALTDFLHKRADHVKVEGEGETPVVYAPRLEEGMLVDQVDSITSDIMKESVFFSPVARNLDVMVRAKTVGGPELTSSDIAVTVHEVLNFNLASERVFLKNEPANFVANEEWGSGTLVLSLSMFTLREIEQSWLWSEVLEEHEFRFRDFKRIVDLYEELGDEAPLFPSDMARAESMSVLPKVLEGPVQHNDGYIVPYAAPDNQTQRNWLQFLQRIDIVGNLGDDPFSFILTAKGRREVVIRLAHQNKK